MTRPKFHYEKGHSSAVAAAKTEKLYLIEATPKEITMFTRFRLTSSSGQQAIVIAASAIAHQFGRRGRRNSHVR